MANGDDKQGGPFKAWLRWAHVGSTVALATFVYSLYHDAKIEEQAQEKARAVLEARIAVLESSDRTFDRQLASEMNAVVQRLDAQRDDIRALQSLIVRHMDKTK